MPQGPNRNLNTLAPSTAANFSANNAGVQIKATAGNLASLNVNTVGVTSAIAFYDGTSTAGVKLGTFSTLAIGQTLINMAFKVGLFAVITGGTPADITVGYR